MIPHRFNIQVFAHVPFFPVFCSDVRPLGCFPTPPSVCVRRSIRGLDEQGRSLLFYAVRGNRDDGGTT